jgi:2-methylisocitrate lyase-like PEP mutase family enzyme
MESGDGRTRGADTTAGGENTVAISRVNSQTSPVSLRSLLDNGKPIVVGGVLEPLGAMILESMGFDAILMGGLIVSAQLGWHEALLTREDVVEAGRAVTRVTKTPLIVDMEHGFGDSIQVERTVRDFQAAGIAGAHLEDSRVPRRIRGYDTVPMEEMVTKIKVAQAARTDGDFFLFCRTEAGRAPGGFDEARRRLHAYAEAGADALLPMVLTHSEAEKIGEEFGKHIPLAYAYIPPAVRRGESVQDIAEMGYKFIWYVEEGINPSLHAFQRAFKTLQETGVPDMDPDMESLPSFLQRFVGLEHSLQLEIAETPVG